VVACTSVPTASDGVPKISQPQYLENLKKQRPDLLEADCKANLIAKPEYRALILNGTSVSALMKDHYTQKMRLEDISWADEHRKMQVPTKVEVGYARAAYYDPSDYSGYIVGIEKPKEDKNLLTHPFIDNRGIGYKVFFQLMDVQVNLRAARFQEFAHELASSGFHGDLKVQLAPGNTRFKFNNIVIHSATIQDSFIAERTGLKFFTGQIAAIRRGVDVDIDPKGNEPALDWSEFLCSQDFSRLPRDVQDYINYR